MRLAKKLRRGGGDMLPLAEWQTPGWGPGTGPPAAPRPAARPRRTPHRQRRESLQLGEDLLVVEAQHVDAAHPAGGRAGAAPLAPRRGDLGHGADESGLAV